MFPGAVQNGMIEKYKKRGLYAVWSWSDLDYFITDTQPEASLFQHLQRQGIRVRWGQA